MKPSEELNVIITKEIDALVNSFSAPSTDAIISMIRRYDLLTASILGQPKNSVKRHYEILKYYKYGWPIAASQFYKGINTDSSLLLPIENNETIQWAHSLLTFSGFIGIAKQTIDCEKAGLLTITKPQEKEFSFNLNQHNSGLEYFDQISRDFITKNITEKLITERKNKYRFNEEKIRKKFKRLIKNPIGEFISYSTTPEIDRFYRKLGHYHLLRLQGYDDFGDNDMFGSIPYSRYIDVIEEIIGVAFKHIDACTLLKEKNPKVDGHNVLSHIWFQAKTIEDYALFFNMKKEDMEQIFSCLTLSKDNYCNYLKDSASPPPPYIQISSTQILRSITGCITNPVWMLNQELKRKYEKDYFKAVNNRELRFRNELYLLFQKERFIKIPNEVIISWGGTKTDIDAIVFDRVTKTLGVFQLKWQDQYLSSMTQRVSRIRNLFPKAQEWLEKLLNWFTEFNSRQILSSLQILKYAQEETEIKEVCIFIIGRNNMNFTNVEFDERAAWASWPQLVEVYTNFTSTFDDPIRALYVGIKFNEPKWRMKRDEMKDKVPDIAPIDFKISNYRFFYNTEIT